MTTIPRLVVAADLHLAPNAWVKHPGLSGDAAYALHQLVSYCIQHTLPLLLLGDTFDKHRPDPQSVFLFAAAMDRMQKAGLHVYYVQGDHDFDPIQPWPAVHPWPMHIHKTKVEIAPGLVIYGLDWTSRTHVAEELAAIPDGSDLIATHLAWSDVQGIGGTDADFAMVRQIVPTRILSGDYHKADTYTGVNGDGQPVILHSPGSVAMQSLGESSSKSFIVVACVPGREYEIRRVDLQTRHFYRYDIKTPEDVEPVLAMINSPGAGFDSLPEVIRKPGLVVEYDDRIPEVSDRVTAAAGDRYHLFLVPRHNGVEEVVIDVRTTPVGAFDNLMSAIQTLAADRPDLYNGLTRVLRSENRIRELETMFEEFKTQRALRTEANYASGASDSSELVPVPGT